MASRKRVEIILNHKEADRIPIDVGSTEVTSINIHAYKTLRFSGKIGCDFRPIVADPPSTREFKFSGNSPPVKVGMRAISCKNCRTSRA